MMTQMVRISALVLLMMLLALFSVATGVSASPGALSDAPAFSNGFDSLPGDIVYADEDDQGEDEDDQGEDED